MLFGAGIVLMMSRVEARGRNPLFVYYRRIIVMGLMGLAHAYLIWSGDVLTRYTMCAAVLCWFRKLSPKWLLLLAIVFHLIYAGITLEHGWQIYQLEGAALESRIQGDWEVSNRTIQHFLDAFRGGYKDQMSLRFFIAYHLEVRSFFFHGRIFQVGAMMLLGMALFKWGVLSGEGSKRLYRYLIGIGLFVGITINLVGYHHFVSNKLGLPGV